MDIKRILGILGIFLLVAAIVLVLSYLTGNLFDNILHYILENGNGPCASRFHPLCILKYSSFGFVLLTMIVSILVLLLGIVYILFNFIIYIINKIKRYCEKRQYIKTMQLTTENPTLFEDV